jgi:thiamine biosynthesis lipoprotein
MKRLICMLLILCVLLSGCAGKAEPERKQYTATFLDLFDTVTTVVGRAESEAVFRNWAQAVHDQLLYYHQLFDIYNDYEGINNLKTVNDNAGIAPVAVDPEIIALLTDCKSYHELTGGTVNPAMGSVLKLWHEARNDGFNDPANAYLPDSEALSAAAVHVDMEAVVIDPEASTVFITDPQVQLDVGAIAKGWAVQRVSGAVPDCLLISVGGNVCATGPKDETGMPWIVGIQDPNGGDKYLHTLTLTKGSVVTSGDYQRAYVVDGELYHHIIDPATLYPSTLWRSVTILCADSGLADALSTALFVLPLEEGQKLLESTGAEAMWLDREENRFYSPGFEAFIRS